MRRFLATSPLLFLASIAAAFDSRNISAEQWDCSSATALAATFAASGGPTGAVGCGTEVLWLASQTMPALRFSPVDPLDFFTVLMLDRDAPNAAAPIRSPLIHMAIADVSGAELSAGRVTNASGRALFAYSGPRPPAGSLCHRYYFQLYLQSETTVTLNVSLVGRYSFDFPTWATQNGLTRIAGAVSYFQTQNDTFRTGACAGQPADSGAPTGAALGGAVLAGAAAMALLALIGA
jgi:phosphatidylethanolamine-binding protein (PEBP) family uncharacterized protein